MAAIRPPSGPLFPSKMNNLTFPPTSNLVTNGMSAPIMPPTTATLSAQPNHNTNMNVRPIFPPMPQVRPNLIGPPNSGMTPPSSQPNPMNLPNLNSTQPSSQSNLLSSSNSNVTQASLQSNMITSPNLNSTQPLSSSNPITPLNSNISRSSLQTNSNEAQASSQPNLMSPENSYQTQPLSQSNLPGPPNFNLTQPLSQPNLIGSSNSIPNQSLIQSNPRDASNSTPTSQLSSSNIYNTIPNPTPPPPNAYNHALNHHQPLPSALPVQQPPPPMAATLQGPSLGPNIRPMYPSPSNAYRTQLQQPQFMPNTNYNPMGNQNPQPMPPPPSSYPYPPQLSQNPNLPSTTPPNPGVPPTYPGQGGQQPNLPPAKPYGMGGVAAPYDPQPLSTSNVSNIKNRILDLAKVKSVVSPFAEEPPISPLLDEENQQKACNPEVMRCSLTAIPQTKDILNKSRLPFGVLIHPFKDLESLSVIQGTKIVRCDGCKSYINPFVTFIDNTRWRCSVCQRTNDLPQEFLFDPVTKTYGDPSRRPEVRYGTVEYVATSDYMARPPQPAMYLFLLDVSHNAIQTGYLQTFCDILYESLNSLPGDARTQIGFITFDSRIHFYDLSDRQNGTFHTMIVPDLENIETKLDEFLPVPDGLMVTLCDCRGAVESLLTELPKAFQNTNETDSALGSALLVAGKLLHQTGGRVTVMQTRIPNINPGALNENAAKEPTAIKATSDFYKKVALDYASQQIACDLYLLNSHYIDLTTLSCVSKYSGGEVKYYPSYHSVHTPKEVERFENDLRRYLQRKIGFEAVMRLRLPPALSIHTFYGSGFVRSVDLLVLPNINPDAAYGMQISIEDSLANYKSVTFQVALLYTSSKGERRIRVHTLSLPVTPNLMDVFANADQEAIVSLVAKMAADRSTTSSIQEARDALTTVACDVLRATTSLNPSSQGFTLLTPHSLRLIPLYMLSLIKSTAFRTSSATKIDDRAYYMDLCKTLPTQYLVQIFYPDLYPIHTIEERSQVVKDGEDEFYIPERVQLSYQYIDSHGAYILDTNEYIYIYVGKAISDRFVQDVFNIPTFSLMPTDSYSLPDLDNPLSEKIHNFVNYLIQSRPHGTSLHIMREDSPNRHLFTRQLIDDKSESTMSYVEFLRYIREQITK